jgi:hypothetical protein
LRSLALALALVCVATTVRAEPTDGGVQPSDAAPPPDTAPAAPAPPTPPPTPSPAPSPPSVTLAPSAKDTSPHARPTAIHRSALFWTSIAIAACAVVAIGVGAGYAASYHPRYALVTF